jgi:hypothetical protein
MERNVVGQILDRTTIEAFDYVDRSAGFAICSLFENEVCSDIKVNNNIVGGAVYAGFVMMGHKCGQADT